MSVSDGDDGFHATFRGALPDQVIADLPRDEDGRARYAALLDSIATRSPA